MKTNAPYWEFDIYGNFRTFAGRSLNGGLRSATKGSISVDDKMFDL